MNSMKNTILITLLLATSITCFSQKKFLRVFDVKNRKIEKGYIIGTTDSSVLIRISKKKTREIKCTNIGFLRTGHSFGHAVLVKSTLIAVPCAIFGFAMEGSTIFSISTGFGTAKAKFDEPVGRVMALSIGYGGLLGLTMQGILSITKAGNRSAKIIVNGRVDEWQNAQDMLNRRRNEK